MVVKSTKLPSALDARIRRAAAAAVNRSSSALMRDAIVRGLKASEVIDTHVALAGFIGAGEAPGNRATNKNYFRDNGRQRAR
jgi:predicted transcriptional regulator